MGISIRKAEKEDISRPQPLHEGSQGKEQQGAKYEANHKISQSPHFRQMRPKRPCVAHQNGLAPQEEQKQLVAEVVIQMTLGQTAFIHRLSPSARAVRSSGGSLIMQRYGFPSASILF
jgi:flagellum-specific peptidoglycan hydrolase FlgJ